MPTIIDNIILTKTPAITDGIRVPNAGENSGGATRI